MRYYIKTFGCQQNIADSQRIAAAFTNRGLQPADNIQTADYIIVNTCMIRESAENRAYGFVNKISKFKTQNPKLKIIVTGCIVGLAYRDKTGKFLKRLKQILPAVDEFLPIEEIGFDYYSVRQDQYHGLVTITNGCNNFCTYCVVPYTRGREISRPFNEIIAECQYLKKSGYRSVTLLGQNVNSYGADIIKQSVSKTQISKPVYVKHLGRFRIPTLFPFLLEQVAQMGFQLVNFISSNPWDFSDELIAVIARNKNITRTIHLPVQSGDDQILKRMNRWYTANDYLNLISRLKTKINNIRITTDIIVGFPGETNKQFQNTVNLCRQVGFAKAYIAKYSPRPFTIAVKKYRDDVPYSEKKKRYRILNQLINKS